MVDFATIRQRFVESWLEEENSVPLQSPPGAAVHQLGGWGQGRLIHCLPERKVTQQQSVKLPSAGLELP